MEITDKYVDELLTHAMDTAKKNREKYGFSGQFLPVAIAVGPQGEQAISATPYRDLQMKALMMKALAKAAREMNAVAVVLVSDTREVDLPRFEAYHNQPDEPDWDKRRQRYIETLQSNYGGSMGDIPRELFCDALLVCIKGPLVQTEVRFHYYKEGVGDSIIWGVQRTDYRTEILMLDDWWDATPAN
jgi:hypothetical protein